MFFFNFKHELKRYRKESGWYRNDSVFFGVFKRKKSGSFSPWTLLQRRVNSTSKGAPMGASLRRHTHSCNLPSIQEFSLLKLNSSCWVVSTQKSAYNPQYSVHIQSVQVWVGKMNWRGKKHRFSPSSFSPPYGFRLPCRSVGLSCRRLQHQLSRQAGAAHFKVRNRLPGPDSCIKNNCSLMPPKKNVGASQIRCSHSKWNVFLNARFISSPRSFLTRFTDLFPDHEVAAT